MLKCIYSVKVNSQAGTKCACVITTQKGQSHKILSLGSQTFMHFARKFSRGASGRRKSYWGFVSVFKNTPKKLILISIFPLKVAVTLLNDSRKGAVGA